MEIFFWIVGILFFISLILYCIIAVNKRAIKQEDERVLQEANVTRYNAQLQIYRDLQADWSIHNYKIKYNRLLQKLREKKTKKSIIDSIVGQFNDKITSISTYVGYRVPNQKDPTDEQVHKLKETTKEFILLIANLDTLISHMERELNPSKVKKDPPKKSIKKEIKSSNCMEPLPEDLIIPSLPISPDDPVSDGHIHTQNNFDGFDGGSGGGGGATNSWDSGSSDSGSSSGGDSGGGDGGGGSD